MSKSHLLVACAVGALVVWIFAPALGGNSSFVFRDAAHFYHPLFAFIREQWAGGGMPLWNPYENAGVPLAADTTSSVFYPAKLIFALPLDGTLAYNLYVVSHVVLTAAGSFWLARHWGASVLAAGLAAVSYAFCGTVLFQYANVVFLVGAAWLPCSLMLADRMLRQRSWSSALGLGVVWALMITGGDPQMAYNAALIAALYALILRRSKVAEATQDARSSGGRGSRRAGTDSAADIERLSGSAGASPSQFPHTPAIRVVSLLAISATTCVLLAAVQILPSWEAARTSVRAAHDAPRSMYELAAYLATRSPQRDAHEAPWYAGLVDSSPVGHQRQIYEFSVGPWRALEYLWPNVAGRQFPLHQRWMSAIPAEGRIWTPSLYMGLLPLLLAITPWSVRRTAAPQTRLLSWLVLLAGLASLGIYGPVWALRELGFAPGPDATWHVGDEIGGVYWLMTVLLPGYVYFRYPAKLLVVASLGLSLLAARGWDEAWHRSSPRLHRWLAAVSIASLLGLFVFWIAWPAVLPTLQATPADPLFGPFDADGAWRDVTGALTHTAVVAVLLLALVWLAARGSENRLARFAPAMALFVTVVELAVAQSWLVPYAPAEAWRYKPEVVSALPNDRAAYRIDRGPDWLPEPWRRTSSPQRQLAAMRWDRDTLWPKYNLPYRLTLLEASSTIASYDYQVLWEIAREHGELAGNVRVPHASVLDLLAARFSLVPREGISREARADQAQPLWQNDEMSLVERTTARPRAWIVHNVQTLPELQGRAPAQIKRRTEEVLFPRIEPRNWAEVAVVETNEKLPLPLDGTGASDAESCKIVTAEPDRVEIEARLESTGLIVLADAYSPGWKLAVDSGNGAREAPILRTNRVLRGALLAAGKHRLVFTYRPASLLWGAAISALCAAGLMIAGISAAARSRRRARHQAP